jgi:hypothetical protein
VNEQETENNHAQGHRKYFAETHGFVFGMNCLIKAGFQTTTGLLSKSGVWT